MGSLRHRAKHGNDDGYTVIGFILGFVVIFALLSSRRRKRKEASYEIAASGSKMLGTLNTRRETLERYVSKLQKQLAFRKGQLERNSKIAEVVTSRVESSKKEEKMDETEWQEVMARGREIYGDAWDNASADSVPLKELMNLNKEELMEIRREAEIQLEQTGRVTGRKQRKREKKKNVSQTIERQNRALLGKQSAIIEQRNQRELKSSNENMFPKSGGSQWLSTRRGARRDSSSRKEATKEEAFTDWSSGSHGKSNGILASSPVAKIPKLDFSRLGIETSNSAIEKLPHGSANTEQESLLQRTTTDSTHVGGNEEAKAAQAIAASHRRARLQEMAKLRSKMHAS